MGQTLSRMELETSKRGIQDHPARKREAMNGTQARLAFESANAFVKLNRYAEALAVEMLPSDRVVIEKRIAAAKQAASANGCAQNSTNR